MGEARENLAARVTDETWRWVAISHDALARLELEAGTRLEASGAGSIVFRADTLRQAFVTTHTAMMKLEGELGRKSGIYHYTGYANPDEMWPPGGRPSSNDN